jgi:hypothetical protein
VNVPDVRFYEVPGEAAVKLNGWQRLWVVVGVLWGVLVAFVASISWPAIQNLSAQEIADQMAPEAIGAIWYPDGTPPFVLELDFQPEITLAGHLVRPPALPKWRARLTDIEVDQLARDLGGVVSDADPRPRDRQADYLVSWRPRRPEQIAVPAKSGQGSFVMAIPTTDPATAEANYLEAAGAILRERRYTRLKVASLFWLVPVATVYTLGAAVGWIRRGFKTSPAAGG